MSHYLNDAVAALESTIRDLREERRQGELLTTACLAIAKWRSDAWERQMFQEGTVAAGAYVWRRIARPLIGVKWRTETRAQFAKEVHQFAKLALRRQGSAMHGAKWPTEECSAVETTAKSVLANWIVCKPATALKVDWSERSAEKALAALREA